MQLSERRRKHQVLNPHQVNPVWLNSGGWITDSQHLHVVRSNSTSAKHQEHIYVHLHMTMTIILIYFVWVFNG